MQNVQTKIKKAIKMKKGLQFKIMYTNKHIIYINIVIFHWEKCI